MGRSASREWFGVCAPFRDAPCKVPCMCARLSPRTVTVTPDFVSAAISLSSFASLLVSMMARPRRRRANEFRLRSTEGSGSGTSPSERARERRARTIEPRERDRRLPPRRRRCGCACTKWSRGVRRGVLSSPTQFLSRQHEKVKESRDTLFRTSSTRRLDLRQRRGRDTPRRARRSVSDRGSRFPRCPTPPRASPPRQSPRPAAGPSARRFVVPTGFRPPPGSRAA